MEARYNALATLKRIGLLVMAVMLAAAILVLTASATAVSPSEEQCKAQGGTFERSQGQVECVIAEEGRNPKFEQEETTTGRGNISNEQEISSDCNRPGATEKCPPGQF
jgi:hypothetical protein